MIVLKEFFKNVKETSGIPLILAPQSAMGNTGQLVVYFYGITSSGQSSNNDTVNGYESLNLRIEYISSGTHEKWIDGVIKESRKLNLIANTDNGKMKFLVPFKETDKTAVAYWSRVGNGQFVYDEDDKSMPVSYREEFTVEIRYPTYLIR